MPTAKLVTVRPRSITWSCAPSTGVATAMSGLARSVRRSPSASPIVASVSIGSVPLGAIRRSKPCTRRNRRNDSRIPVASITMSRRSAAATATPRTARTVRAGWRRRAAAARRPIIGRSSAEEGERGQPHEPRRRERAGTDPEDDRQRDRDEHDVRRHARERQGRPIDPSIVPVDRERRRPADGGAEPTADERDQRRLDDDRPDDRPARDPEQPEGGDIAAALIDPEHEDAEQEDGARDDRDERDRSVEAVDDLKRPGRSDRHLR